MRAPVLLVMAACGLLAGCSKDGPAPAGSAAPAGASAPASTFAAPIGAPIPVEKVAAALDPGQKPPYAGPKGRLRGTVRIDGDPPPDTGLKFPDRCKDAVATYGKLFRVGLDKTLADAMVGVIGYDGFVPAEGEAVKVPIHHCAPAKRTYVLTYGQRLDAFNLDVIGSYMPYLDGAPARTIMVAIPKGDAVKLYPYETNAHYMLRDQLDSGLVADVFVFNYATHDVTGLDGQYEIKNIPVGQVRVRILLPVIDKLDEKVVDIKEGDNTLDVTLHFDAQKDIPRRAAPPASASASAAPATSTSARGPATPRPR